MRFNGAWLAALVGVAAAQNCAVPVVPGQYTGTPIPHNLPIEPHAQITYFKIKDPSGQYPCNSSDARADLSLVNYMSLNSTGKKPIPSKLQRAVIVVAGLYRDAWNYQTHATLALHNATVRFGDVNRDTVAIMSPFFADGNDKNTGYPWNPNGEHEADRAYSPALVWYGSEWSAGGRNQYPPNTQTVSSFDVLDQIVQHFNDKSIYPNMKQIVVAGHSLGAQMVLRYAAIGKTVEELGVTTPVSYYIGNPNSYTWMETTRPLSLANCSSVEDYEWYRNGWTNYEAYGADHVGPMTYQNAFVAQGHDAIKERFMNRTIMWGRATLDKNDRSGDCAPFTQGRDRNERFWKFLNTVRPTCDDPQGKCDTVDLVATEHKAGVMFASEAGQARLFLDNFNGNKSKAHDFGYPRRTSWDDPYPDPAHVNDPVIHTDLGTYGGGKKARGCWSDIDYAQQNATLANLVYTGPKNNKNFCSQMCTDKNFAIAGVRANECYCGNQVSHEAVAVVSTSCEDRCPGNTGSTCGGNMRLNLFSENPITKMAPPS